MGGKVPRRLRRFQRQGEIPEGYEDDLEIAESVAGQPKKDLTKEEKEEITMQLALDEVKKFKEQHKRLPKKEEYEKIAESIYEQLHDQAKRAKKAERLARKRPSKRDKKAQRDEKRAKRKRRRGKKDEEEEQEEALDQKSALFGKMKGAAKGLTQEEIKGMSVEDLFGGTEKKGKGKAGQSIGDEFDLAGLSNLDSSVQEEREKCPKCGAETDEVVFCPECGTAFCENCAKKVEKLGSTKTYTCPKCKNKIKK